MDWDHAVIELDRSLPELPANPCGGSLLVMVGLPGTGKSLVAHALQVEMPHLQISTDRVRKIVLPTPTYSEQEKASIYRLCFALIELRLKRRQRVIFDGVNQMSAQRNHAAAIAWRSGAAIAFCYMQASPEVIHQRLRARQTNLRRKDDMSDADLTIYRLLVEQQEPMARRHLILDSTARPADELAAQLSQYWKQEEIAQCKER